MNVEFSSSWVIAILPEILLAVLLVVVQIYDRVEKPADRSKLGVLTAWGGFIILLIMLGFWLLGNEPAAGTSLEESLIWGGMIRHDLVSLIFRIMFLVALIITALISLDVEKLQRIEYYLLLITGTMGFNLMAASSDLIMLYIALEMASISSYVLAGIIKTNDKSSEAGMKYFVYGAFATGVMLYGMSILYGVTAQTNLYTIGAILRDGAPLGPDMTAVLLLAATMIIVGFGFKISAVPFHFWTPDVYEGAPTPFTAFVSTASKAAGFAIFIRVFSAGVLGDPSPGSPWWAMLVAMCIVTMSLGNFVAIFQNNLKRLLAYSSIAQAGYAMIGLLTFTPDGSGATMFYLLMYVFTNVAAFGVIIMISNVSKSDQLTDLYGLNRRAPYLALIMLLALLSLGGIPPTAGFVGKFLIFRAAIDAGYWWLALIGILNAFVALYYYLNLIKYMYLYNVEEGAVESIPVSRGAWVGLVGATLFVIILGVIPGFAYDWTTEAAAAFYALLG